MIATSMLRRQVWMVDDDKFDHIVENSKRILKLNPQYENNPYVEEFTRGCNVMFVYGTYVLVGETDATFFWGDIWKLFHEDLLPNNASNFWRQMTNCMRALNCIQKTSGSPLNTEVIKQTHKMIMHMEKHKNGKDVLSEQYRKLPVFAGYIFAPAGHIERHMEGVIFRFHETKKDNPIMATTNLFGNIINIHPFEVGNGRICRLILAHVLMQMKCWLFPVILSSFHRRGRRHYIRAVKMFDRKRSILYTMVVKSLIHCWNNFEQNTKMLTRC